VVILTVISPDLAAPHQARLDRIATQPDRPGPD
jgi:hypothetical protein